jgi:type IV pilus assembly protein PilZ
MTLPRAAEREKRDHPRAAVEIAVSCEQVGVLPFVGKTRDLGIGGAFIESAHLPPFGAAVVVVGRLPGATNDLRLPGIVRWVKPEGFGVQFGCLGPRETHAILTILK